MHITAYIHPTRTYLPCTGVGRHINQILLGLTHQPDVQLELFFSAQWLNSDSKLDPRCPLRHLPARTFPTGENPTERRWKLLGRPCMDEFISDQADWLYAPVETYLPVSKCPVAITIHDIQAFESELPWSNTWRHRWFRYKWGRWVRRALADCRVVFTVSEFSKQRIVNLLGGDPKKLVVVGNGIDSSFFEIAKTDPATLPRLVDEPYTIVIGGLRRKKGADQVLAAARMLHQRRSDLQIVVVGEKEAAYAEAAKAYPNLKLLGMVADQDLPQLVRGANSLLFLSPYEGFGIPALEAMAAGIPAVVSNRAALPEVVGSAGIIVDPDQIDLVVNRLMSLLENAQLHQTYVQQGQYHAAQYTWSRCVERVMTTLQQFA